MAVVEGERSCEEGSIEGECDYFVLENGAGVLEVLSTIWYAWCVWVPDLRVGGVCGCFALLACRKEHSRDNDDRSSALLVLKTTIQEVPDRVSAPLDATSFAVSRSTLMADRMALAVPLRLGSMSHNVFNRHSFICPQGIHHAVDCKNITSYGASCLVLDQVQSHSVTPAVLRTKDPDHQSRRILQSQDRVQARRLVLQMECGSISSCLLAVERNWVSPCLFVKQLAFCPEMPDLSACQPVGRNVHISASPTEVLIADS